jgi:hypothetical protein
MKRLDCVEGETVSGACVDMSQGLQKTRDKDLKMVHLSSATSKRKDFDVNFEHC